MNEYHCRCTSSRLRMFCFDAGVFFPLIVLDRRGFTLGNLMLFLRARIGQWLGGGKRPVESHIHLARRRDYVD